MFKAISAVALVAGLASVMYAAPASTSPIRVPVAGTGTNATFQGNFQVTGFHFDGQNVLADGIITGVATSGGKSTSVLQTVSAPLQTPSTSSVNAPAAAAASCSILNLVVGPVNLNLLGLQITTDQIVLNITALPGAGNLLGNLLCDVTNLLNSPSQGLANVLNQILGILQGL